MALFQVLLVALPVPGATFILGSLDGTRKLCIAREGEGRITDMGGRWHIDLSSRWPFAVYVTFTGVVKISLAKK